MNPYRSATIQKEKIGGMWNIIAADGAALRGVETMEIAYDGYGKPLYGSAMVPMMGCIRWETKSAALAAKIKASDHFDWLNAKGD